MLLDGLKQRAESYLNNRRLVSIITVSPSFCSAQRAAILDAASVASLPVSRLVSDPLAAACAFRHHEMDGVLKNRSEFTLLVVDVGACTTDASVVLMQDKQKLKLGSISLVSTRGSSALGGIDFDRCLCEVLLRQLRKSARAEVRADKAAMRRLMVTSEELKMTLSMVNQVRLFRLLSFQAISCNNDILFSLQANVELADLHDKVGLFTVVRRRQFEEACEPLFEEVIGYIRSALDEANMVPSDIDEVR